MAAIFGPRANLIAGAVLLALAGLAGLAGFLIWAVPRMQYNTQVSLIPSQPVPFSHRHHAGELGIDCCYCHGSVEVAPSAGMPSTQACMTCHSQLFTHAEMLAPVRRSLADGKPLQWTRVYTLPDYVYFDHSIHVAKGVGCTECHGPIGEMAMTRRAVALTMRWCLDCHRNPAPHLRPREEVFNPDWRRTATTSLGAELMAAYHIHRE